MQQQVEVRFFLCFVHLSFSLQSFRVHCLWVRCSFLCLCCRCHFGVGEHYLHGCANRSRVFLALHWSFSNEGAKFHLVLRVGKYSMFRIGPSTIVCQAPVRADLMTRIPTPTPHFQASGPCIRRHSAQNPEFLVWLCSYERYITPVWSQFSGRCRNCGVPLQPLGQQFHSPTSNAHPPLALRVRSVFAENPVEAPE